MQDGARPNEVTQLLVAWGNGDQTALDQLMPLVYSELHRIAHRYIKKERPGHTLQTSALLNEAFMRLVDQREVTWQSRAHFFAIAAQMMRRILVDYARSRRYAKRGGDAQEVIADPDLAAGMAAVNAQQWDKAIPRLNAYVQRKPDDADAWNELAHAHRMTGDLDNAFKGYARALEIDPKHRNAHEYLGEAYLQAGDLVRAEAELRTLDKLCFLPCEQYSDLKEEVRRYKAAHPVASR